MANRPIPVEQAKAMMGEYASYMQKSGAADQTRYISFTGKELLNWLSEVMPFADELRICEGIYPAGHPGSGKITAILWPYKNGSPAKKPHTEGKGGGGNDDGEDIKPYNEGTSGP